MTQRIVIEKDRLVEIQEELKDEGHTLEDIKTHIGSDFRNFRYKGHPMDLETFNKLRDYRKRT